MQKIKQLCQLEKESLPLFAPAFLGIGILIGVYFPLPNYFYIYALLVLIFIYCIVIKKFNTIIILFSLGFYISQTGGLFKTELLINKKYLDKPCDKITFRANIDFIDETHPTMKNMQRVTLSNIVFKQNKELEYIKTAKMTCSAKLASNLNPNDKVKIFGRLLPLKSAIIPLSYDQKQYYALNNLDVTGIIFYIKKLGQCSNNNIFPYIRRKLTKNIIQIMGKETGGIASSLLTGDKSSISTKIRDIFIKSGTAHILAISGLHMALVSSIIYIILSRLLIYLSGMWLFINPQKLCSIFTIILTYFYLAISGFSPSATRAFLMTTLSLISLMLGRKVLSLRNIALSAFFILIINPGSLFSVSFQLSFSAVVVLLAFYNKFGNILLNITNNITNNVNKIFIYIGNSILTTILATVATAPISIATFNKFSLCGILGNIIGIPLTTIFIIPFGILCLIGGYKIEFFISGLNKLINLLIFFLDKISNLPYSDITIKSPNITTLYIIIIGGLILCLLQTKLCNIGLFLIILGVILWIFKSKPIIINLENTTCYVQNNEFFVTSKQKDRRLIFSIQRNLGLSGDIIKTNILQNKILKYPLYIFSSGRSYTVCKSKHPYCPLYYKNYKVNINN